ncbi:uncharacterized protein ATNIH1004_002177 [Aspergillus tanneri]|uniref:Uncharacterized protein n=1 Tax=Aspergillus tanneri TaxID=1220188 RepID=A0A5M9MU86_9EURO|nr:uncharacterized protein ATNIH1004_002177 [Aspergillus tanneri]KAA8649506.1 hypothetical protein ATNIH1004_002177 [Aspergillus tanneri]
MDSLLILAVLVGREANDVYPLSLKNRSAKLISKSSKQSRPAINSNPSDPFALPDEQWETPGFAYFNNQFILHLASAVHNPLPSRKLLSPGVTCPAVRGVQEEQIIPITDIFDEVGLQALGYETDPLRWSDVTNNVNSTRRVRYYREITESPDCVIQASASTESYWKWSAIRFTLEAFILPFTSSPWRSAARQFQLARPLQKCVDSILPDVVPHAIAMHLRMWPSDLSFGQDDACHTNEVPVLKYIYSKCAWTGSYLYQNIMRVQNNDKQPVIIATDDRRHSTVLELVRLLGPRAHFMEMTQTCKAAIQDAYPHTETEWRIAAYWPIIEAATMVQTEIFVGSFWSTFSQLVAVRRHQTEQTFFVQNRLQELAWQRRWLLITLFAVGIVLGSTGIVRRLKRLFCSGAEPT